MKKRFVKAISLITATAMVLSAVSGIGIWKQGKGAFAACNVVVENPSIKVDNTGAMLAGQTVTWDCVYFGSYPQSEVVGTAASYTAVDIGIYDTKNIIYDENLYEYLSDENLEYYWVTGNDKISVDGSTYCRVRRNDAADKGINSAVKGYYQWEDDATWHYFKYEPIKWRVLSTDGKKALLLADKALDNEFYDRSGFPVSWGDCSVRSWLNGYAATENLIGKNYEEKGFVDVAFAATEAAAILETELTDAQEETVTDKVFLLSKADLTGTETAEDYGFLRGDSYDEARVCASSTYAKAMGVSYVTLPVGTGERLGGCGQLLRNAGEASVTIDCTKPNGMFDIEANIYQDVSNTYHCYAIRPALYLDLSKVRQYEFAGTVSSDNTELPGFVVEPERATLSPEGSTSPSTSISPSKTPSPSPTIDPNQTPSPSPSINPDKTSSPNPSIDPSTEPTEDPSETEEPESSETPEPTKQVNYKGKKFKDEDTMGTYKITKTGENGTVVYLRPLDKTQSSVSIPDEVEYKDNIYRVVAVGENAFYKNKNLRRITLGDNITKISNRAFYKCTNLKTINFNDKLKRIGTKAFFRCNSLKKIVLPYKVEHIGVQAFYKCKNLQKAVLSKNMLEIGTKSFYKCKKLTLDMSKVKRRHIAMGRKPFTGVKKVKYGKVKTRP